MLFNSFEFAVFFLTVFSLYWLLPHKLQNLLLLAASYFFLWVVGLAVFSSPFDLNANRLLHCSQDCEYT